MYWFNYSLISYEFRFSEPKIASRNISNFKFYVGATFVTKNSPSSSVTEGLLIIIDVKVGSPLFFVEVFEFDFSSILDDKVERSVLSKLELNFLFLSGRITIFAVEEFYLIDA